jgi:isopentenyl-diphosphate delta-isomerase
MSDQTEIVDTVDENDVVIGRATRQEAHDRGLLHRAVHILAFDRVGKLILQKRADGKEFNPNRWTSAVSGHVTSGDTYNAAAEREVVEELQLSGPPRLNYIGKVRCDAANQETGRTCRTWTAVYTTHLAMGPTDIQPQVSEVTKVDSFLLSEVLAGVRGETGPRCTDGELVEFADNFAPVVELLGDEEKGAP